MDLANIEMMRKILLVLLSVLILCPAAARGAGFLDEGEIISGDRKVEVYSEKVQRDADRKVIVAEGAVDIRSGKVRLRADRVELNDRTMDLTATGNVVLEVGEDRLQGEYMEFNLETEVGYVIDGQGFSQAYYFAGERIDKISDDRYRVRKGSFTSCEGVLPDWSFRSPRTLIHVDHYIYTSHPTMWVKKVPVLYLPYAIVPIKRERATGLLIPRLRYHKNDGLIIGNSFFWAPVDNADATIYADYYSRRGWRLGLEGRYIFSEETSGRLLTYFIRDRLTESNRWDLKYLHKQVLPWEMSSIVNVTFLSDRRYKEDYEEALEDLSEERLDSFASISREWKDTALILSAEYEESLSSENKNTLTRFPELNLKKKDSRVGKGPIFWSMRGQVVGLRLKKDEEVQRTGRLNLKPKLSTPFNISSWATIRPSFGVDYTYYTRDVDEEDADRFVYNPSLAVTGPKFYRIFGKGGEGALFKHLIVPKLTYNYIPDVDQANLPNFDGTDRISSDNSLTYSLTNQVLGKFVSSDEKTVIREVLRLDLSQTYDLDPPVIDGRKEYMGDLRIDLSAEPAENLSIDADAVLNVHGEGVESINYGFQWDFKDMALLSLERRYRRPSSVDYLEGRIGLKPGRWDLLYRGRYDLEESAFVENLVEAKYTAQCWDVTLTYIKREFSYEYRFLLNLKEIGTIIKF